LGGGDARASIYEMGLRRTYAVLFAESTQLLSIGSGSAKSEIQLAEFRPDVSLTLIEPEPKESATAAARARSNVHLIAARIVTPADATGIHHFEVFEGGSPKTVPRNILVPGYNTDHLKSDIVLAINPFVDPRVNTFGINSYPFARGENRQSAASISRRYFEKLTQEYRAADPTSPQANPWIGHNRLPTLIWQEHELSTPGRGTENDLRYSHLKNLDPSYQFYFQLNPFYRKEIGTGIHTDNMRRLSDQIYRVALLMEQLYAFVKPGGKAYVLTELFDTVPILWRKAPAIRETWMTNLLYRDPIMAETVFEMLAETFPGLKITPSQMVKDALWPSHITGLINPGGRESTTGYIIEFQHEAAY